MANLTNNFDDSAMIALLPTTSWWCEIELPHMTLAYAGKIADLNQVDHNAMVKTCLDLALTCYSIELVVLGHEVFGDEEQVDVLRLRSDPDVLALYSQLKHWDDGSHPFNPHVTVGPVGTIQDPEKIPDSIQFDRIAVAWGDSVLPYKLL